MAPLRYTAKLDPFLSLDCTRVDGGCHNPRKGRDQILPSGNLAQRCPATNSIRNGIRFPRDKWWPRHHEISRRGAKSWLLEGGKCCPGRVMVSRNRSRPLVDFCCCLSRFTYSGWPAGLTRRRRNASVYMTESRGQPRIVRWGPIVVRSRNRCK